MFLPSHLHPSLPPSPPDVSLCPASIHVPDLDLHPELSAETMLMAAAW